MTDSPERPAAVTPGDAGSAFRAMFDREYSYVWHSARRMGVPNADRDDVVLEVFHLVYLHFERYDPKRPIRPWLFAYVARVSADYRRRVRRRREVLGDTPESPALAPTPEQSAVHQQALALVNEAMESLDDDRRAVFILHDLDEVPMLEIVEALAIPLNTGYSRLRLARQDLAAAIQRLRSGGRAP